MSRLARLWDQIRDSEAYQQIKAKYDELDAQTKLYVNFGALGAGVLAIFLSITIWMAKLGTLKAEIDEREELIGYLQRSADTIRQLKAQQASGKAVADPSATLPSFVDAVVEATGLDRAKVEAGSERTGTETKEAKEALLDVKLTRVNLKQLTRFLFAVTEQGASRNLSIKELSVDTKGEPTGFLDASATLSAYRAK